MGKDEQQKRIKLFSSFEDRIEDEVARRCIKRSFIDYSRTQKAEKIFVSLEKVEDVKELSVLDYGCGVGDYGFYFAGKGSKVTFYDFNSYLGFTKYRVSFEKFEIEPSFVSVEEGLRDLGKYSLIIFGDVLEHLESPLDVLKECLKGRVKYLVTTYYPYVTYHGYFLKSGHWLSAEEQQEDCIKLLEENYERFDYYGKRFYLWKMK